jgi:N-acetyl-gamma-glutamylphosphate reductase
MHYHNKEKQQSSFRSSFAAGSKIFKMQIIRTNTFPKNGYLFVLYNFVTHVHVPDLFKALQMFQNRGKLNFQYHKIPFNRISFIAAKLAVTTSCNTQIYFTVSLFKARDNFRYELYYVR